MKTLTLVQGSPEWLAHRAQHFNASDAPAMMACSPYKSRTQLLHEKHTGISPDVDVATQRRFDEGHRAEALARPLAEKIIGEDLYPVTGTMGELSASFDGLTMAEDVPFEHKALNEELRAIMIGDSTGRDLPLYHRVQMEQQLLVCGGERTLFMASKWEGDTLVEERHCWYEPDLALRAEIIAGWKQFAADLATYVPTMIKEMPKAEVTIALPALVIHAKGEITTSNMKEYGIALAERLAAVRAIPLVTDQDFSNAKESAKLLRENVKQAKLAKEQMLAQTVTVGEAARMIDAWCEDMQETARQLEKDVEREDAAKKAAMIAKSKADYEAHLQTLQAETGGPWIVLPAPDWAGAIKGKRSFVSMQDALDTALAGGKIAADESARKIRASIACMDEEAKGFEFQLNDRLSLIGTPVEHLRTIVRARVTEHKAAEQRRLDAERERIRAEEAARADREAQERIAREQRERQEAEALERRQREEAEARERQEREAAAAQQAPEPVAPAQTPAAAPITQPATFSPAPGPVANVVPIASPRPAAPAEQATLTLGAICTRLGVMTVTADQLATLGIQPAARERAARLYTEGQYAAILAALSRHIDKLLQPLAA